MYRLALPIALAVVSAAAADDARRSIESLFPLAIGNTWTYKVSGQKDRFRVRAIRHEMVADQECTVLEATFKGRVIATEHVAFMSTGLVRFREDKVNVEPPLCVLRAYPPKMGWTRRFILGNRGGVANFQISIGETTVPAGKFKTTIVRSTVTENGRKAQTSAWYAEGVGMVRQTIDEGKRQQIVLELEKFEDSASK